MGGKKVFELILDIGHKSTPLSKKLTNGYTHKWTAFVRGYNNAKIEHCIQRVVFQLHESFPNPYREVTEPPFQIKETGYAGFEIPIQIYFKNKDEPNHLVFVHDLCLLTNHPNDNKTTEKIKFINPNKEFEKCLIKSGAQLLTVSVKKDRSGSPPAKKQKSSSLIPSKDMNNKQLQLQQPTPQSQPVQQSLAQSHHHPSHKSSSSSSSQNQNDHHHHHNHNSGSNHQKHQKQQESSHQHHHHHNSGSSSNHHKHQKLQKQSELGHQNHHHQSQVQQQQQQQQQPQQHAAQKPKVPFMDLFGAPIVFNRGNIKMEHQPKEDRQDRRDEPRDDRRPERRDDRRPERRPEPREERRPEPREERRPEPREERRPEPREERRPEPREERRPEPRDDRTDQASDLQLIRTKISCLTDCDRLQKIVDIVEEAGEWFNLTPKKFEFDLKRLDRKTLNRIERCLQH